MDRIGYILIFMFLAAGCAGMFLIGASIAAGRMHDSYGTVDPTNNLTETGTRVITDTGTGAMPYITILGMISIGIAWVWWLFSHPDSNFKSRYQ